MTAVLAGSERTGGFRASRFRPGRALRLEIKHSAVVWVLPVLAILFYVNAYRRASGYPPVWTVRASALAEANVVFFSVIATGIAAWAATRESRRKTGDLLATTARAPWARQLTVLAATTLWNVLAYLAGVAVIYVQTALQATWGGPPLWPVAAGAVTVAASCAVGFVVGTLLPGRFTAPIAGVAVFVAWFIGVGAANAVNGFQTAADAKGSPALFVATDNGRPPSVDVGVFYRVLPDVSIAQVMFTGGVLLAMVGLLALLPATRASGVRGVPMGRRRLTALAAVFVACGAAASATAFSLAGTARYSVVTGSWEIPALHDAANDRPVPYTLRCTGGAFQVCIHPAFDPYLSAMNAALQPAAAEVAGLPGAPARAEMTTGAVLSAVAGTTSVYEYSPDDEGFGGASFWTTAAGASTAAWEQGKQQDFITWFTSGPAYENAAGPTPAQEAVAIALLAKIGAPVPPYPQFTQFGVAGTHLGGSGGSSAFSSPGGSAAQPQGTAAQISAAAHRFGSLPPAAGRAWLTANMAALRSGAVTLAQLP